MLRPSGFELAGQHTLLVTVAEDVGDDGLHVVRLVAALGEGAAADRVGVDDLEEEAARALVALGLGPAVAESRKRTADEAADDFVDQRKTVALVRAEREKRDGEIGVGGGVAVFVHGGEGREGFALALELLDAAHGDDRRGPIDDDGIADGVGGGEAPRVRIGAEGGEFTAERDDLRERGGAVRVGDVALLRGVHHVAAAPKVVEGVVDGDGADAVLVGEADGFVHGAEGGGLAEFFIGVPDLRRGEAGRFFLDLGAGDAAL